MPTIIQDVVKGALKLTGILDRNCYKSWVDAFKAIPSLFSVEIPADALGVIISATEPNEGSRNKLWIRQGNSGTIIGMYIFTDGAWNPFYNVITNDGNIEIKWIKGDSANPPDAFEAILPGDPVLDPALVLHLIAYYLPNVS